MAYARRSTIASEETPASSSKMNTELNGIYSDLNDLDSKKSSTTHDHDEDYSAIDHDHDEDYSAIDHDHDEDYADIDHNHDDDYADINHNHDEDYLAKLTPTIGDSGKVIAVKSTEDGFELAVQSGGISDVVDDTTPQLGGNLDVNGKKIVSASNGDIPLAPNGSGMVKMEKGVYFSDYISNGTDSCTIDWRASNKQLVTPSGNRTYTFTAPTGVTSLTLVITVTASRTLYWPAAVSWRGGAPATTAAGTYIATFFWDGTNYFGTCTGKD